MQVGWEREFCIARLRQSYKVCVEAHEKRKWLLLTLAEWNLRAWARRYMRYDGTFYGASTVVRCDAWSFTEFVKGEIQFGQIHRKLLND